MNKKYIFTWSMTTSNMVNEIYCHNPIQNLVHVACMLHAYFRWWHALTLAHVICRFHLYQHACSMHISCNMHGFGTFSMHATCMLHDMHVTCVKQLRIKTGDWEVKKTLSSSVYTYMYSATRQESTFWPLCGFCRFYMWILHVFSFNFVHS